MSDFFLRTLGSSALIGTPPPGSAPLRSKDLALLVFLCVNGPGKHTRGALATLLWGDRDEPRARHSLTQALRHLRRMLGDEALVLTDRIVDWRGDLPCDALELERAVGDPGSAEQGFPAYCGDFLADLDVGHGAVGFSAWADERRARFRFAAARVVSAQGSTAESLGRWDTAVQLGIRLIEIEPMSQQAHRRVMRAWSALGERGLAVRHYHQFERWLRDEWGEQPDPATRALYEQLHAQGGQANVPEGPDAGNLSRIHSGFSTTGSRSRIPVGLMPATGTVDGTSSPISDARGQVDSAVRTPPSTELPTTTSNAGRVRARRVVIAAITVLAVAILAAVVFATFEP